MNIKILRSLLVFSTIFALLGGLLVHRTSVVQADDTSPLAMNDGLGTAKFSSEGGVTPFRTSNTIPWWSSSFTYGGVTYPYFMVGTDPSKRPASTTVPTVIIPMRFVFAASSSANYVLDGGSKVAETLSSPIFQNANFQTGATNVGMTQYGDAIQKAMFWNTGGSNPGYHVLLRNTNVFPTQTIDVPQNQGSLVIGSRSGALIGLMDESWFSNRLKQLMGQLHIPATTLPIFLTDNTFLYQQVPSNCCILGYHGASSSTNGNGSQQVQTYMFAAYIAQGVFRSSAIQDIHGLSHEVSEWYADPFVNNLVPPWLTPTAPQYGCTSYLETGDPVVGFGFPVSMPNGITYHPEDEVYYSWFAREAPSRAANGWYTWMNTFPNVAQGCN